MSLPSLWKYKWKTEDNLSNTEKGRSYIRSKSVSGNWNYQFNFLFFFRALVLFTCCNYINVLFSSSTSYSFGMTWRCVHDHIWVNDPSEPAFSFTEVWCWTKWLTQDRFTRFLASSRVTVLRCISRWSAAKLEDGRRRITACRRNLRTLWELESKNAISIHRRCLALQPPLCVESGIVD